MSQFLPKGIANLWLPEPFSVSYFEHDCTGVSVKKLRFFAPKAGSSFLKSQRLQIKQRVVAEK